MIKAIIFDLDGVIVDSEAINLKAGVTSFKEIGIDLDEEDKQIIVGRHPIDYNKILARKYQFDNEKILKRQEFNYLKHYREDVELFEGAEELILDFKKRGLKVALATSSPRKVMALASQKFDFLKRVFEVVVTFDDCDKRKPAPDMYLLTAKKLGVKNRDCLVIEDTAIGVEAAKKAGMKCIAVPNQYTKSQDFSKADFVVKSLGEINPDIITHV